MMVGPLVGGWLIPAGAGPGRAARLLLALLGLLTMAFQWFMLGRAKGKPPQRLSSGRMNFFAVTRSSTPALRECSSSES